MKHFMGLVLAAAAVSADTFNAVGNKVYLNKTSGGGAWVVFNGIGLTCTEYMQEYGKDGGNYPGWWSYANCFGGPGRDGGQPVLNGETQHVIDMLSGGNYARQPGVKKVQFAAPYDEVIDKASPGHQPMVRVPMSASCYLYDDDVATGSHMTYVDTIDLIVQAFTEKQIAVVLDLHWNCPESTKISSCPGAQSVGMALKNFGTHPGALTFWDTVSKRYASNPYVFYELFNEPYLGIRDFDTYYAGSAEYAGVKEMYNMIRSNDPTGMVIVAGASSYAWDAQSLIGFSLRYKNETGTLPSNVMYNHHPYQGASQGLEKSLPSGMRLALASKTVGPVIFTEFGQYCCGAKPGIQPCENAPQPTCNNPDSADNFVHNIVNFALQYDISWMGWGWRGNNGNYPCGSKENCNGPDMRSEAGTLTNGTYGGADWAHIWQTFVTNPSPEVQDVTSGKPLGPSDKQPAGYLPRPCIYGVFNIQDNCGFDLARPVSSLPLSSFTSQSVYNSYLPGLPPSGNCKAQSCLASSPCQTNQYCS